MSNKSLGNLTVNLVLNTGSFTEGYTSADRVFNQMNAQVERQQKALEKLTKQFDPTTAKIRELADSQRVLNDLMAGGAVSNQTYDRLSSQLQKMSDEVYSANSALAEQARQVSQLVNQLDPAIAKYAELDIMQNRLQEGLKAGLVSTDDFERYSAKLASTREEYDKLYTSAGKLATEQEKQQQELSNILRLLDPVNTKLAELDAQQQKLASGLSSGTINQSQYDQATAKLNEMRQAIDGTTEAQRLAEAETAKQVSELQRLSSRLDPLTFEFKELDKAQRLLQSGLDKGLINSAEYERMSAEVNRSKKALNDLTNTNKATELSAKQLKQSLAGLPAQFTDIVVSLQGGQNPFTVFLQQGGQIKDQFGGSLPAVKAMAGYIAGLINPFTVAAGAAGVLGYAYYKASIEQDKFRDSIIFTGNAAGVTVDGLNEMSKQLAATIGTQGKAAEAIAAAATTGKFTADQLALVSESAVRMERVTGKAIDDTVKEFEKLAKDPTKEIAKLNEEQNFLTVAIYEQIKALEEQGKAQEAATLAMKTYSEVTANRTSEVIANLGSIESAWIKVSDVGKKAWDQILNLYRGKSPLEEMLEDSNAEINRLKATLDQPLQLPWVRSKNQNSLDEELANNEWIKKQIQDEASLSERWAKQGAEFDKIQKEGIESSERLSKSLDSQATKAEKRNKELKAFWQDVEKLRAADPTNDLLSEDNIKKALAGIDNKYKETKSKITDTAAQRLLMQLNEQQAALSAQLDSSEKLTKSQKALAEFEQQIADIKEKKILTADQKSLLANEEQIRAEHQQNVALDEQLKKKNELIDLDNLRAGLSATLLNDQEAYQDKLLSYGSGNKEIQRLKEEQKIRAETNRMIAQLNAENSTGAMSSEAYQNQLKELKDFQSDRLESYREFNKQVADIESDWAAGANEALINYAEEAQNTYQTMSDAVTDILGASTSSVSGFLFDVLSQTESVGDSIKGLFNGMAASVLKVFSDITAEWLVMQALELAGITTKTSAEVAGAAAGATAQVAAIGTVKAASSAAVAATVVEQTAAAATVATVWSPAAIWASIGSFGQAAVIGGAAILAVKALGGFQSGGYTGDMGVSDVAGVVHGKEFVFDAAATSRIGVDNLERMRRGLSGFQEGLATMPKFDDGIPAMRGASAAEIGSVSRNDISISVPVVINGDPDEKTLKLIQKATMDGAAMAYRKISGDLATGRGDVSKAVQGGWSVSRRKR